jgi:hypothetical protein
MQDTFVGTSFTKSVIPERLDCYISGVTTTRLASRMLLAEGSGAARHLQKVLLQIDKRYYTAVICIFGEIKSSLICNSL